MQATWLGYFATTGVAEIDAILVDRVSVLPGQEGQFTERLVYLPETRLRFTPPSDAPAVANLSALQNGYVTFACFQNFAKVGDVVMALWAKIMATVPTARLRWQCKQFADLQVIAQTQERLTTVGIPVDRVNMLGAMDRPAYLGAHAEVDIILDTFPYPGGTITCEALWMGVPTLTLAGIPCFLGVCRGSITAQLRQNYLLRFFCDKKR